MLGLDGEGGGWIGGGGGGCGLSGQGGRRALRKLDEVCISLLMYKYISTSQFFPARSEPRWNDMRGFFLDAGDGFVTGWWSGVWEMDVRMLLRLIKDKVESFLVRIPSRSFLFL